MIRILDNFKEMMTGLSVSDFRKEILGFLIIASFTYLFFDTMTRNAVGSGENRAARISTLKKDIAQIEAEISIVPALKNKSAKVATELKMAEIELKALTRRLPADSSRISRIINELTGDDFSRGVKVISVKPLPPVDAGELTMIPLQLTVQARLKNFGNYLERIENLRRVVTVDNFRIESTGKGDGESPVLNIHIYLSAYSL